MENEILQKCVNLYYFFIKKIVQVRWWRWGRNDVITPEKVFCIMCIEHLFDKNNRKKKKIDIDVILFVLYYMSENRRDRVIYYLFVFFFICFVYQDNFNIFFCIPPKLKSIKGTLDYIIFTQRRKQQQQWNHQPKRQQPC